MDYKYIEQLLERYWKCETSMEEEQILKAFFRQKSVPAELEKYKVLFSEALYDTDDSLSDDFDEKVLSLIRETDGHEDVEDSYEKGRKVGMTVIRTLMPLIRACAIVAVVIVVGALAQMSVGNGDDSSDGSSQLSILNSQVYDDDIMFQVNISDDSLEIINIRGDLDEGFIDMMTDYYVGGKYRTRD